MSRQREVTVSLLLKHVEYLDLIIKEGTDIQRKVGDMRYKNSCVRKVSGHLAQEREVGSCSQIPE